MNVIGQFDKTVGAAALVACLIARVVSASSLDGHVLDYALSTPESAAGVAGVEITVLDMEDAILAEGLTNAAGFYEVSDLPDGQPIRVEYRRIGYVRRPTVKSMSLVHERESLVVYMVREGDSRAYYSSIASRVEERAASGTSNYESEWLTLRSFGLPPDRAEIVASRLADTLGREGVVLLNSVGSFVEGLPDLSIEEANESARRLGLLSSIYFAFDAAELEPESRKALDRTAALFRANPGIILTIEGHADERGTNEYNMAIASRRAEAVREYLTANDVPGETLTTISYGEERPACTPSSEDCWKYNRRAHLVIRGDARDR